MNNLMTKSFLDYVELKKQALKDDAGNPFQDIEKASPTGTEEDLFLFFQEVASITSEMDNMSNLLFDLRQLHQETKSTHSPKILRGIADRMTSDMLSVLQKADDLKSRLRVLDSSGEAKRNVSPAFAHGSLVDRTRSSVIGGVRTKLREMMSEFQELRELILLDHREGLRRRYFAETGVLPNDEVLDRMASVGGSRGIFSSGKKGELEVEAEAEAEERRRAVGDLQRSLNRLHRIFLDMALVVEAQGEEMNDIESNVANAKSFIVGGTASLSDVSARRKKGRTGRFCLCAVGLAVAMIIVFLVLGFVG
ncbi:hypothetical protein HPP92_019335 [Vanilla planifolia]|uniref:t-SNARE coiled-coil homology domain-containing protein n=1 Tax=Vanilla planifolia TaxID=51239 RepID=A0A835PZ89_VANPL|nr:hypothetical protein HPP92_019335 [Vanilla planifolia]